MGLRWGWEIEGWLKGGPPLGEVENVRRPVFIAVDEDGERPIVGYATLELLGFKVNPVAEKVEKTFAIEDWGVRVDKRSTRLNSTLLNELV
ncbi:TPA: hypothetical protein EYP26_04280 [Candidatus Bathyarchaeota archaeon]|nr:hypothetical protein [Candidatus Bathyarchaeota archaeon]